MPLNISGALIRIKIREFIRTRQQITDVIIFYSLEKQEQEYIY
jgi:hypothetical protein